MTTGAFYGQSRSRLHFEPRSMVLSRLALVLIALARTTPVAAKGVIASAPVTNAVTFTTITGSPLTIRVGEDMTFQVYNSSIPASLGQIFPHGSVDVADMGVFARASGVLCAPDFTLHTSGTSTGVF